MSKKIFLLAIIYLFPEISYGSPLSAKVYIPPQYRELWYDEPNQQIEYKVTNTSVFSKIKCINIFIPSGFTYVSCNILEVSMNKKWRVVSFSSNKLTLKAYTSAHYLQPSEYIRLQITLATQKEALPAADFLCEVKSETDEVVLATEEEKGSGKVAIISLLLTAETDFYALVANTTSEIRVELLDDNREPMVDKPIICKVIEGDGKVISSNVLNTNVEGKTSFIVRVCSYTATFRFIYHDPKRMKDLKIMSINTVPDLQTSLYTFIVNEKVYLKEGYPLAFKNDYADLGAKIKYKIDDESWQFYDKPLYFKNRGFYPYRLTYKYVDGKGNTGYEKSYTVYVTKVSDVKLVNYPNPFAAGRESTFIEYTLDQPADVSLSIYDLFGNCVWRREFLAGEFGGRKGINTIEWNGRNSDNEIVANGGYICQLIIKSDEGSKRFTRKIAVRK